MKLETIGSANGVNSFLVDHVSDLDNDQCWDQIEKAGPRSFLHCAENRELDALSTDLILQRGFSASKIIYGASSTANLVDRFQSPNQIEDGCRGCLPSVVQDPQIAKPAISESYINSSKMDPALFPLDGLEPHKKSIERYIDSGTILCSSAREGNVNSILVIGSIDMGALTGNLIAWIWLDKSLGIENQRQIKSAWITWMKSHLSGPIYSSIKIDNFPSRNFHLKIGFSPICLALQKA